MSEPRTAAQSSDISRQPAMATAAAGASGQEPGDAAALSPDFREREEITALLMGFGTGLGIAFIFLAYIVLEAAKLLP